LDAEFTRVYEEYTRRIATVQTLANNTIQLWAELGTAQEEQDSAIVKYYREQPEQLGLHERDIAILRQKRDSLSDQKKNREKKLQNLRANVEALWIKLDVDPAETKPFLNQNRGCGLRQISQFEAELARLNELKHQNLHLFVEDSRVKLQELWDSLYFSEDEMLEFTPAFSDVYSDALLEAHEREVARLEALKDQRGPTLALIDRHKSLIKERDDLATSSQDASRLMMRGQKGEKRDPGKLLREEKMRKRIAKELPKVTVEVRKILESWEEEYGRPFLVYGERYLDELEADDVKKTNLPPRSKTPAGLPPPSTTKVPTKTGPPSRANSTRSIPPRSMTKTPTAGMNGNAGKKTPGRNGNTMTSGKGSPSRIPARAPLSNLKHGSNSPERPRPESRGDGLRHGAPLRAPPPKMRELVPVDLETPANPYKSMGLPGSIVRRVEPEDVYDDRPQTRSNSGQSQYTQPSSYCDSDYDDRYATIRGAPTAYHSQQQQQQQQQHQQSNHHKYPMAPPPPRHVSGTSTQGSTNISGSENWETYDDNSEPEPDASEAYYAKLRAARGKRMEPESGHENVMRLGGGGSGPGGSAPGAGNSQSKRVKGIPPMMNGYGGPSVMVDQESGRIVSGSEWTDEDAY
jgi:protein regulator of cytokinesis 1